MPSEPTPPRGRRLRLVQAVLLLAGLGAAAGIVVAVVDVTDHVFSTNAFCAHTCHVMESTVFPEYQESKHWNTATGVRPACADCHVSRRLTYAMIDHILGMKELYVWAVNDFSELDSFEAFRPKAADHVRFRYLANDSANCRSCHEMEAIRPARIRGQNAHENAIANNATNCIACHYNLVHKEVEPSERFLAAIEKYVGAEPKEETSAEESAADDDDFL
jgi:nitrate/TMAO reductase-like tetraheme cytochrome c subunit